VKRTKWLIILAVATCLGAGAIFAQQIIIRGSGGNRSGIIDSGRGGSRGGRGGLDTDLSQYFSRGFSTRSNLPEWQVDKDFPNDVFTFVRVQYTSRGGSNPNTNAIRSQWFDDPPVTGNGPFSDGGYRGWRWNSGKGWNVDYPDSDYNFVFRLHQLTSIEVHPEPIRLTLTDPELFNYPFLYLCAPGALNLSEAEVKALRKYLLNGGFLWMDDFWGDNEWENVYDQMKRVFPEKEPIELPLEHPIFNCVFVLKKKPQILNVRYAGWGRESGVTWERPDGRLPHYMAINDDKGRLMVLMSLNSDTGDGWEQEGNNEWFFHTFSESQSYPLGINVVFYVMTH
jgi:hypothetical protein